MIGFMRHKIERALAKEAAERKLIEKIDTRVARALIGVNERIDHVAQRIGDTEEGFFSKEGRWKWKRFGQSRWGKVYISGERTGQIFEMLDNTASDRIYQSKTLDCRFRWRQFGPNVWRKVRYGGPRSGIASSRVYDSVEFLPDGGYRATYCRSGDLSGEHWVEQSGPSEVSAVEHTEHKKVGDIEHTVTDRVEFDIVARQKFDCKNWAGCCHKFCGMRECAVPKQPYIWGDWVPKDREIMSTTTLYRGAMPSWRKITTEDECMTLTVSMFELSLLAWRASHRATPYPRGAGSGNPATVKKTLQSLEGKGLIKFGSEECDYTLTPRAECLIEAMAQLPLPIKAETPWTMPE